MMENVESYELKLRNIMMQIFFVLHLSSISENLLLFEWHLGHYLHFAIYVVFFSDLLNFDLIDHSI